MAKPADRIPELIRDWSEIASDVLAEQGVGGDQASELGTANAAALLILTEERIRAVANIIPDEWLLTDADGETSAARRQVYVDFLTSRIRHSEIFVKEAQHARQALI